jgi:hypothetical protein
VAAKKGGVKFKLLLGAVNQDAYADHFATLLIYGIYNLAYRVAGGNDVINDEDSLTRVNAEAPPESSLFGAFLFGKYTADSQLSGYFKSQDNTAGSGSGYHLNFFLAEVVGNHAAKLLSISGEL